MLHQDAVRHGQTTEFFGAWRCKACVDHDRKCWIREDLNGCIVCSSNDEQCIFERFKVKIGLRDDFSWEELVNVNDHDLQGIEVFVNGFPLREIA